MLKYKVTTHEQVYSGQLYFEDIVAPEGFTFVESHIVNRLLYMVWMGQEAESEGAAEAAGGRVTRPSHEAYVEITQADVRRSLFKAFGRTWQVTGFIGRILEQDVGKRVFLRGNILQVENDEQRTARLAREGRGDQ